MNGEPSGLGKGVQRLLEASDERGASRGEGRLISATDEVSEVSEATFDGCPYEDVHDIDVGQEEVDLESRSVCEGELRGQRHLEPHPGIIVGRRTHVTRRLARQLVRDVNAMSIREVSRRHDLPWHFIMTLTASWSELVSAERRRRRCRTLLVDETSLRRGHRYVTVVINGDTGETLGIVAHRDAAALSGFLQAQGHRWLRDVRVVVSDGSKAYRSAIGRHLGHATHVLDRFHIARWFAAGMIEVRRRIQRIGDKGSRPAFEPAIFRSRYLQLTRADHLTDDQTARLGRVLACRPELEAAWRMLQHLYGIHVAADNDDANQALGAFLDTYHQHPLLEFERLCDTLLEWGDEIFAFHDTDRATAESKAPTTSSAS